MPSKVAAANPEPEVPAVEPGSVTLPRRARFSWRLRWMVALAALVVLLAAGGSLLSHRTKVLTERDTIVLADFANSTGGPGV